MKYCSTNILQHLKVLDKILQQYCRISQFKTKIMSLQINHCITDNIFIIKPNYPFDICKKRSYWCNLWVLRNFHCVSVILVGILPF